MMKIVELKPCPFCGGAAHLVHLNDDLFVECWECGARTDHLTNDGENMHIRFEADAVRMWNRRDALEALDSPPRSQEIEIDDKIVCGCGGKELTWDHPIGEGECLHQIAPENLIPTNFRKGISGYIICDVAGYVKTENDLRRLLYYNQTGTVWTCPKTTSAEKIYPYSLKPEANNAQNG